MKQLIRFQLTEIVARVYLRQLILVSRLTLLLFLVFQNFINYFLTARRYASAAGICCRGVSVRLSVRNKPVLYRKDWRDRTKFWHGSSLWPILNRVLRKFGYPKNKGTSVWNFAPNSGLRKFLHGKSVVNKSRRRSSVWITSATVECVVAGCTEFVTLLRFPLLRFVLDLLYSLFLQATLLYSSWQTFDWHISPRGPSAIAELLDSTAEQSHYTT